LISSFLSATD